jgi:hypothetical protein
LINSPQPSRAVRERHSGSRSARPLDKPVYARFSLDDARFRV